MKPARHAGLLVHPTSLPSRFGIGDFGPAADAFLDWAASAGQSIWQVLPLGPTAYGNAPYGCLSAFAGNPMLISPERLLEEGLLDASVLDPRPRFPRARLDYEGVAGWKERVLRASFARFRESPPDGVAEAFRAFRSAPEQHWLEDWALFSALKDRYEGAHWTEWDVDLSRREPEALAAARLVLAEELDYRRYLQFLFFRQWERVRNAAKDRGLAVLGDIPIYVAHDSADVWARRELFTVDEDGRQETVAGVPPDYFSRTGQLWGNPLYRWDVMEEHGFSWWIERVRANLRLVDILRIDHFRGLASFWEVPAGSETAISGCWVPAPGSKLFAAIRAALGDLPLVAEDLGDITQDVCDLLEETGLPGMRILQFAFDGHDHEYLPHRHVLNSIVYTGTHDNNTTRSWFDGLSRDTQERVLDYAGASAETIEWDLIRLAYTSVAKIAIVPLQDVFGLGEEARMNVPGKPSGNWLWRARKEDFTPRRAERLRRLAELTGRIAEAASA